MKYWYLYPHRSKDYSAPVNFVSAGLRKTAAEEKAEQEGSDDSNDSGDVPPPPRAAVPKKLQTVKRDANTQ